MTKTASPKFVTRANFAFILFSWMLLVTALLINDAQPLTSGKLVNNDDYSRMVMVFELIDGTSESSYIHARVGVGGTEVNWSRLVDWPLAAIQMTLEPHFGRYEAALYTSVIFPAFMLLLFFFAAVWFVKPLARPEFSIIALPVAILLLAPLRQFAPGRVDHHMVQILLVCLAYGNIVRVYLSPERIVPPVLAGLCFALGLAIGADIIPWMALAAALTGFYWLCRGNAFEKPGLVFGLAVCGFTIALHFLLPPYDRLFTPLCETLSPVFIYMTGAIAAVWAAVYLAPVKFKQTWQRRLSAGLMISAITGGALYMLIPSCVHDPYQFTIPEVKDIWLAHVKEAKPIYAFIKDEPMIGWLFLVPVILAVMASLAGIYRYKGHKRIFWTGYSGLMAIALALSCYQLRTIDYAQVLSILPLVMGVKWLWLPLRGGALILQEKYKALPYPVRIGGLLVVIAILSVLTFWAIGSKQQQDLLSQLAENAATDTVNEESTDDTGCHAAKAAFALRQILGVETIAADVDIGPEIVYFTPHRALAAPYHRNEHGLLAAHRIMTAPTANDALEAMNTYGATIIIVCSRKPNIWLKDYWDRKRPAFAMSLIDQNIPSWLEKVDLGETGGYLVFKRVYEHE